jgi:hypothetical protein
LERNKKWNEGKKRFCQGVGHRKNALKVKNIRLKVTACFEAVDYPYMQATSKILQ